MIIPTRLLSFVPSLIQSPPYYYGFKTMRSAAATRFVRHASTPDAAFESEESAIDKALREFFTDDSNFSTSGRVLSSFLKNCPVYTDGNDEILSDLPLLTKYFPPNNEEYQNSIDKDIFAALYSPPSECRGKTNKSSPVTQKRRGQSFKVHVAYQGEDFCGWQIQPDNDVPSIQQTLIDTLDPLLNAEIQKSIDIRVCGRTDAGVSAIGQVCRVRTIRKDVKELEIQQCINTSSFGSKSLSPSLGCVKVEEVSEKFHPTFDATQRGYAYMIDIEPLELLAKDICGKDISANQISISMNSLLKTIEGDELDYLALSFGKVKTQSTLCTLRRVRTCLVETSCGSKALCLELIGDRFLRRMVRILVATTLREALSLLIDGSGHISESRFENESTRLLELVKNGERRHSAKAASPNGLIFVGASF
mmetsp:Transcript_30207/g.46216  ORF Transcript_30207/g.46216 Transcript_30207/m.46216 type:complete len:421 (+) Transcript_30207:113-1375(+)